MRSEALEHLRCPACRGRLTPDTAGPAGDEAGFLRCAAGHAHPVAGGIPHFAPDPGRLTAVARSFGFEWLAHAREGFEKKTVWGRTPEQEVQWFLDGLFAAREEVRDRVILDAGCGRGRLTGLVADLGARAVFGMDLSAAVQPAHEEARRRPNLHVLQANVFAPPFAPATFDFVYSSGVIHHTPDARAAHAKLAELVKPGGRLFVWVYARQFNVFRWTKNVFDWIGLSKISHQRLYDLCAAMGLASWWGLQAWRAVRSVPLLRPRTWWARNTVRERSAEELAFTWFDALSPEFDSRHTEAEVTGWFQQAGFEAIRTIDYKVGVCGTRPLKG